MTAHSDGLEKWFYDALRETPELASSMAEVRNKLIDGGFYSPDIVAAAFQKWEGTPNITLVDAFGFACVWHHYVIGDIAVGSVPLPSGPWGDREIEKNQAVLDRLPSGFRASFLPSRGGGANDDGLLSIKKGIGFHRLFMSGPNKEDRVEPWFCATDTTLPLEVGTTSVSRTLLHLRCGGVARWPYGYEKIIVMVGVNTGFKISRHEILEPVS